MPARPFHPVAILVLLCAAIVACAAPDRREQAPQATTTIDAIGPKGEVRWPFVFEWKTTAPAGAVYRITISDVAERPLLDQETRVPHLEAPAELRALLSSSRRFLWRVAVVDGNGQVVAQTEMTEFTVK